MAITNKDRISRMLDAIVEGLGPVIARELQRHIGSSFQQVVARDFGVGNKPGSLRDPQVLLKVTDVYWNDVFRKQLGRAERSYVNELVDTRNAWAHGDPFSYEDTERALDTAVRLLRAVSAPKEVEALEALRADLKRTVFDEQRRQQVRRQSTLRLNGSSTGGLKPWREVIQPHRDVASGRFSEAEFAADLAAVHRGGAAVEYDDPDEFFRRTFLTEGLSTLLKEAMRRFRGEGGDPVVELLTNFGGGKTHSMLALYHLVQAPDPQKLAGIDELMAKSGIGPLPAKINRAVLVGTALSPANPRTHDGHVTRTLWGEMAWQLAGELGLSFIEESDKRGTAPGSDDLVELLRAAAPCLILVDEWVAFIRQLYTIADLPAGSFDANVSFAQALTEAVKHVPDALLVASLPASQIEIGGEGGQAALDRLKQTFGRVESSWRPATVDEGFEIVRRRLFEPIAGQEAFAARDNVVKAYFDAYREGGAHFPRYASEPDYRRRLEGAYPIHPELFDRLNNDWGALERFQRTRGVLRLMATVVNALWEQNDKSPMIMPSSLPMDDERVQVELTRYLEAKWDAIIATDIDGGRAHAAEVDRDHAHLGQRGAARRVARALFLASAPQVAGRNPGVDDRQVKLAAAQPGEPAGVFGDALRLLADRATYLYTDNGRYWFDTQPTVTRLADERAELLDALDVREALVKRLQADRERGAFSAVHVAPRDSGEVPDEPATRLVVLAPEYAHASTGQSEAQKAAEEILTRRGGSPRVYRNALLFMAADSRRLGELEQAVRTWLGWSSIANDKQVLNLNDFQERQANSKRDEWDRTVAARLRETWVWAMRPHQPDPRSPQIEWEVGRANGQESLAVRAAKRFETDGVLYTQITASRVKDAMDEHDLWQGSDHLGTKALWGYFATYLYLPRLTDRRLLEQAIHSAISTLVPGPFAYAEGYSAETGTYAGLHVSGATSVPVVFDDAAVVVKAEVAARQIEHREPSATRPETLPVTPTDADSPMTPSPAPPTRRRFFASVELSHERAVRQLGDIKQEVLDHLLRPGAKLSLRLEIDAENPAGFDDDIYRVVTENCRTLNIKSADFDD